MSARTSRWATRLVGCLVCVDAVGQGPGVMPARADGVAHEAPGAPQLIPARSPQPQEPLPLDRQPAPAPPGYVRPPAGFVPFPSGGAPLIFAGPPSPGTDRVWIPSRTEVVIGRDRQGRLIFTREYVPGRFAR
jgi:hypothetical protein